MNTILTKKEAMTLDSYIEGKDGEYEYRDKDGLLHIIKDGKDSLEEVIEVELKLLVEKLKRHIER